MQTNHFNEDGEMVSDEGSSKGEITFPDKVKGKLNGVDKTLYPNSNWFSFQSSTSGEALEGGRHKIVMGPKILNPSYPDNGKLWAEDFGIEKLNVKIDIVLKHKADTTAPEKILKCVAVGLRAHTYNLHPDKIPGQEHKLFNYNKNITASFEVVNGLLQTGIAYPNSWNAQQDKEYDGPIAVDHMNGSPVEFYGTSMGFAGNDYKLVKLIVLDE